MITYADKFVVAVPPTDGITGPASINQTQSAPATPMTKSTTNNNGSTANPPIDKSLIDDALEKLATTVQPHHL